MLRTCWPRTALIGLVCTLAFVFGASRQAWGDGASSTLIYDLDFSSPLHSVGSAPTTGAGPIPRATPTSVPRNPVLVVDAYGDLASQPLAFPGPGRGDVDFSLAGLEPLPAYKLEMDVVVDTDLRILLNAPNVNLVHFQANGNVVATIRDAATSSQTTTVVATYTPGDGAAHHIVATVDLELDTFELQLDGASVHASDFGGQSALTLMRLMGTQAAVDGIRFGSGEDETVLAATVDVRPWSKGPATINLRSRGVLPIALLSAPDLDAANVDAGTLLLSDSSTNGEGLAPWRSVLADVDGDGWDDLIMLFSVRKLVAAGVVTSTTTSLTLSGETLDGAVLLGSDDVHVHFRKRCRQRLKIKSPPRCAPRWRCRHRPGSRHSR